LLSLFLCFYPVLVSECPHRVLLSFSLHSYADHRHLHSFPTRRSSDLLDIVPSQSLLLKFAGFQPAHWKYTVFVAFLYWAASVPRDRKSTRLNSSHVSISYAVFCLKKKKQICAVRQRGTRSVAVEILRT